MTSYIKQSAASSRSAINNFQRQHFCTLLDQLIAGALSQFGVRTTSDLPEDGWERFAESREYQLFIEGAYACGFVCSDLRPNADLTLANQRPDEELGRSDLKQLRRYVHTLIRSERVNHGYGSNVWDSTRSGALECLLGRLVNDQSLLEPV